MADFSLKITAASLGKTLAGISEQLEDELEGAVEDLAYGAYAKIAADAQAKIGNPESRQEYLKGLEIVNLGSGSFLVTLNTEGANKLEDGYDSYSLKDTLLSSNKVVQVGPRAGQPWVQKNQENGQKFAHVPMQMRPASKEAGNDLGKEIQSIMGKSNEGRQQRITKIFRDNTGKPLQGRVATGISDNPLINKVTKYQKVGKSGSVSSTYINYRTIAESSSGWQHPGHDGYGFFQEAEDWVAAELENIIGTLL